MTLSADLTLVEAALDALEQREARVLVWGLVDTSLSEQEVYESLNRVFESEKHKDVVLDPTCSIHGADQLLLRLKELGLILEVPSRSLGESRRWRTRMAEGLRLMARLRQLMPRHKGNTAWVGAPTLVADFRLLWRPRKYPKRDLTLDYASETLERSTKSESTLEAVRHWLSKAKANWKLSRFQLDAAQRVLTALDHQEVGGTLVSAGTGSGKTLAFYLPALSWLAGQKTADTQSPGVRILAIYPRNELLKDQLSEVYGQARKFDDLLGRSGGRPISLGVLFGDTPSKLSTTKFNWKSGMCPFFRCPRPGCDGTMHLLAADYDAKVERITCSKCGEAVDQSKLRLTRESMQQTPPDILFTSVEMLNQRMADSEMHHLFGLGPSSRCAPSLVLLDEVHVYSGTYGSQVAYLLRRWAKLLERRPSFVGLSATISEGERFFSSLIGLSEGLVKEVTPNPEDMEAEGAEYLVALRGDPVSQSALLSTSIQTLMLGTRLLDLQSKFDVQNRPFAGWRAFAFTDQMDATNRLYADLQDAEGRNSRGDPATKRHPEGGLAHLRKPSANSPSRYEAGQDWLLPTKIGHDLHYRLRVGRTTAYDAGVATDTEIVVATAALEVGYDDEAVGFVLQHKAPRDMAQFLQRKGRAGRTRHMRPWTVMVLSDYGRDRMAYQAYEQFFDPELPPRDLPLANRYVQRMQAAYALIDYLGVRLQAGYPKGSVWRDLSGPPPLPPRMTASMRMQLGEALKDYKFPLPEAEFARLKTRVYQIVKSLNSAIETDGARRRAYFHLRRTHLSEVLRNILSKPQEMEGFIQHLISSLSLSRQSVDALLWEHPRPLLLEVAPTAQRRLSSNWRANGLVETDFRSGHPLPEFVPATLFSDLTLPEVAIARPKSDREAYLSVQQALSELAPGKVSKRFDQALWLGVPENVLLDLAVRDEGSSQLAVDVEDWYSLSPNNTFQVLRDGRAITLNAFTPRAINLLPTPDEGSSSFPMVMPTSNARLIWESQIFSRRPGHALAPPNGKVGIASLIEDVRAHTHALQSPATVRRYATGSMANLRLSGKLAAAAGTGEKTIDKHVEFQFVHGPSECGIGFEIEVDALRFDLHLPQHFSQTVDFSHQKTLRAIRTARFFWEARYGQELDEVEFNPFLRNWIAEIFLTSAIRHCSLNGSDLASAIDWISASKENLALDYILETIFQAPSQADVDDHTTESSASTAPEPDKLRARLREAFSNPELVGKLGGLGRFLTDPVDDSWNDWLKRVAKHTLAAAILEAIQRACPQVDGDALDVDIESGPAETGELNDENCIWITEINPGGNGLIEQIVEAMATDPTGFYRHIEAALGMSEFEVIDEQLRNLLERVGGDSIDSSLLAKINDVRYAQDNRQTQQAVGELRRGLVEIGHVVFHGYVSALANRLLRPSTPGELDRVLVRFMVTWERLESDLGIEVDARIVCAMFSDDRDIDTAFSGFGVDLPAESERPVWRFSMLMGIVWARGHALRANALPLPARYARIPAVTERLILQAWLSKPDDPISASDSEWLQKVHERLGSIGRASVSVQHDQISLANVFEALVLHPVQMEYLNVYPILRAITRSVEASELHIELQEAM